MRCYSIYFLFASFDFHFDKTSCTIAQAVKSYNQYCPVAHALDVVGERWSLLIVRELIEHDQLRYSDLHANLTGCGTNILASRLKELERHGVVRAAPPPPPAASTVYELTEYGQELAPGDAPAGALGRALARAADADEELEPGWLAGALEMALPAEPDRRAASSSASGTRSPASSTGSRGRSDREPRRSRCLRRAGFYHLLVDRQLGAVRVEGDSAALDRLLDTLPCASPVARGATAQRAAI